MLNLAMKAGLLHDRLLPRGPFVLFAAAILFVADPAAAASFVVNSTVDARDANAGDGICATGTGVCSLRAAIEETNALAGADSIRLPAATFLLTLGNGDDDARRGDFDITDTVSITGSGEASTILDGNSVDRLFDVHEDGNLNLSRVTIRNGDENQGAGIRSRNNLVVTNVTFSNNVAKDGGGIYLHRDGSTAIVSSVTFINNSANKGGGFYAKDNTRVSIADSSFRANFAGNSGVETRDGGAVYFDKTSATITRSVFDENNAEQGGALFAKGNAIVSIADSTVSSNSATKEGGGAYFDKATVIISRSVLNNNRSQKKGGGLFVKNNASSITLVNVTLSGNSASDSGGGIHKEKNGIVRLTNVTVFNNRSVLGAGVYNKDGTVSALNTIVAKNIPGADCAGTITSLGNNLSSDSSCQFVQASDLPNTDPLLGPLQNNGGPTVTHALLDASPARDAGTNAGCPANDQRGTARPTDSDADGVSTCDIGAYEADPIFPDYDVSKSVATVSDPYSGGANAKSIPGAVMQYTISLGNDGPGAADQNTIVIMDAIPPGTSLVVADFDAANPGPVAFVDGTPASGLSYGFTSLSSVTDDVDFSSDGGLNFDYTPTPGADGSDTGVTHIRISPQGTARFTGADPVAHFDFKVIVR